jgi:hypothetical protein
LKGRTEKITGWVWEKSIGGNICTKF